MTARSGPRNAIELPAENIRARCGEYGDPRDVVVVPADGEVLVLVRFYKWLLHVDMDSNLASWLPLPYSISAQTISCSACLLSNTRGYVLN